MKPATEILLSAAFVLTPKEHWTQRADAKNASGREVSVYSPWACRWCLDGAIKASVGDSGAFYRARNYLWGVLPAGQDIVGFNDAPGRTHAEVLAALYRAAELSEAS